MIAVPSYQDNQFMNKNWLPYVDIPILLSALVTLPVWFNSSRDTSISDLIHEVIIQGEIIFCSWQFVDIAKCSYTERDSFLPYSGSHVCPQEVTCLYNTTLPSYQPCLSGYLLNLQFMGLLLYT